MCESCGTHAKKAAKPVKKTAKTARNSLNFTHNFTFLTSGGL